MQSHTKRSGPCLFPEFIHHNTATIILPQDCRILFLYWSVVNGRQYRNVKTNLSLSVSSPILENNREWKKNGEKELLENLENLEIRIFFF